MTSLVIGSAQISKSLLSFWFEQSYEEKTFVFEHLAANYGLALCQGSGCKPRWKEQAVINIFQEFVEPIHRHKTLWPYMVVPRIANFLREKFWKPQNFLENWQHWLQITLHKTATGCTPFVSRILKKFSDFAQIEFNFRGILFVFSFFNIDISCPRSSSAAVGQGFQTDNWQLMSWNVKPFWKLFLDSDWQFLADVNSRLG